MGKITQEIIDYIASYGGTPEELTPEEIDAVIEEYDSVKKGEMILDGILFGRFPLYQ